ncbi:MAG: hypothetical protein L0346_17400 [Chloroflexi bacterium]|nr:hypothetical protein [Chloroflexota bacterium]
MRLPAGVETTIQVRGNEIPAGNQPSVTSANNTSAELPAGLATAIPLSLGTGPAVRFPGRGHRPPGTESS